MAIDYDRLMNRQFPLVEQRVTPKDCILFALGLGLHLDFLVAAAGFTGPALGASAAKNPVCNSVGGQRLRTCAETGTVLPATAHRQPTHR